jgi:predicted ATPase
LEAGPNAVRIVQAQLGGGEIVIMHFTISNYRSIGEAVELSLGPLTALVGPNGSGKSNLVDAIRFLADALRMGLEAAVNKRQGIAAMRRWSGGRRFNIRLQATVKYNDRGYGEYEVELCSDKDGYRVKAEVAISERRSAKAKFEIVDGVCISEPPGIIPNIDPKGLALPLIAADPRFRPLADALRNIAIYSIFPNTLRVPQHYDPRRPMDEHGENWCSILQDARGHEWVTDLRAALGQITGDIDDIKVTSTGTYLAAAFRHGQVTPSRGKVRERWFASSQESDGTLRLAGIITALLQEPPLTLIGIEEPELTVHPGALPVLYDFLLQASKRSQVVITTHSPELLELLKADEIRVVERHKGVTTVGSMDESQREAVHKRLFTPGELMRLEGLRQEPADNGHFAEGRAI